jgi:hypothetical protein
MKGYFRSSLRWSINITLATLILAAVFSITATFFLTGAPLALGMLVIILIIFTGIAADTIGLSAAASTEKPFHAMASKKINGAKEAIQICRRAPVWVSIVESVPAMVWTRFNSEWIYERVFLKSVVSCAMF